MMENVKKPENQGHPEPGLSSLEHRVSTLERQIAEQQDQLRNHEKSLVERIADVDDDRRTTASKLQRGWQSRLEEFNDRLGRQMTLVIGVLVLFLVLVGVVLFLAYHQADNERQLLAEDLAALKQELAQMSVQPADADSVRAELTRLSAAINNISSSHGRQDEKQVDSLYTSLEDERITRDEADAVIREEVQRLETKLESLIRKLETLRAASETADIPAAATELAIGEESGKAVTDAMHEAETAKTLVVADRTYALQLIGFYSLDRLLKFANRNDLPERLYYREEVVQGRPWFALIHSLHEDYASTKAQLHQLSPELVAMEPWIRSIPIGVELTVLDKDSQRRP